MREWPHFPENQLPLPGLDTIPVRQEEDKTDPSVQTRRSPIVRASAQVPCRVCGEPKTVGLPCPCWGEKGR
jgi:hypothetical protein